MGCLLLQTPQEKQQAGREEEGQIISLQRKRKRQARLHPQKRFPHTKLHIKDQKPHPRSPARTLKSRHSGDSQGVPYNSDKRRSLLQKPSHHQHSHSSCPESSPKWVPCRWPWTAFKPPRRCLHAYALEQHGAHGLPACLAHLATVSSRSHATLGASDSQFHLDCAGQSSQIYLAPRLFLHC